jgi:hypothetical protein
MKNLDHPLDQLRPGAAVEKMISQGIDRADRLGDEEVPVVNGRLESTWRINRQSHTLEPIRGISFDLERPVFSSTSSWLLGRNVAPLDEHACALLALMDGKAPWSSIVQRYSGGKTRAAEILSPLLAERFVLVRGRVPSP